MELNSGNFNKLNNNERKFLIIKLPADVQNVQNAIGALGGRDKIFNKVKLLKLVL
jgi:hypothetical protein